MSFDQRNLKRLENLSRQLPQPIENPKTSKKNKNTSENHSHIIETETNPQSLFHELIQASTDGRVPPHLLNRLKEIETIQVSSSSSNIQKNQATNLRKKVKSTSSLKEESLYIAFREQLIEDDES
mgnify:CR=1 FL=1